MGLNCLSVLSQGCGSSGYAPWWNFWNPENLKSHVPFCSYKDCFLHHALTEVVERADGSDPWRPSKVEFADTQTHILFVESAQRLADLCPDSQPF